MSQLEHTEPTEPNASHSGPQVPTPEALQRGYESARNRLLGERNQRGHWRGELASSALSTATAISALAETAAQRGGAEPHWDTLIDGGCRWLDRHQNDDGGWGDTDRSHSNIATSMLVRAAFHLAKRTSEREQALQRVDQYIDAKGGVDGLRKRYGKDKTFAVPILSNCAIAGLAEWKQVAPLPFELSVFPQSMYRFLQMPVVSYAIPALVAIGQARHRLAPSPWPWIRLTRAAAVQRSLKVLQRMQPESGGYLEATPLTSFVVMNLAASGQADHPVVDNGIRFLIDSVREDGSWPIDTDLATWNTTLSLNALHAGGEDIAEAGSSQLLDWLLECQHLQRHPFTGAEPGGWGWTDLSGAVPDSDDTPGALLALDAWRKSPTCDEKTRKRISAAAREGVQWLLNLQNRDGGWPTFCRGWGKLPFDRSGADLTAHALRALDVWQDQWEAWGLPKRKVQSKIVMAVRYLERLQRADGSWLPLWFGNQDHPEEENPVYGTAKVLLAAHCGLSSGICDAARKFLVQKQQTDGGWGSTSGSGPSSMEETALAVEALLDIPESSSPTDGGLPNDGIGGIGGVDEAVERGLGFLLDRLSQDNWNAAPIGFYFAKLWYHERLYPIIFVTQTLGKAVRRHHPSLPTMP